MNVNVSIGPDSGPFALRFRAIAVAGKRRGFRLESIFWSALEVIASRNRRTLPGEIAETLRDAQDHQNASALLRARVAADLIDLWSLAEARSAAPAWGKVLMAMPTPAFALSRSEAVAAINEPMRRLLERRGLPPVADNPDGAIKVEFPTPILTRQLGLEPGAGLICNATFKAAGRLAPLRVRLVRAGDGRDEDKLTLGFPDAP